MFIGKNVLKHLVSLSVIKEDIIVEDWDNHILMSPVNDSKASPYTLSQSLIAITPLMTEAVYFKVELAQFCSYSGHEVLLAHFKQHLPQGI